MKWRHIVSSALVYGAGTWVCHAAVMSLTTEQAVDSQNGFHMAVYGDFSRANLLKIENSFQIHRCDRETLFLARQYEQHVDPGGPPLAYIGLRYSRVCRALYFQELKYNLFRYVSEFPVAYWQTLDGLKIAGTSKRATTSNCSKADCRG